MRLYRFLLRLLPRGFRERNGAEMEEVAEALLGEREALSRPLAAARACLDLVRVALRLRMAGVLRPRRAVGLHGVRQDVILAVRSAGRRPGFALVTVGILALGIGATTTIFTVVDGVLMKPLPYRDADRIGVFWHEMGGESGQHLPVLNPKDIWDFREWSEVFETFTFGGGRELIVGEGEDARITEVASVEAGFFEFFGHEPEYGRSFRTEDDVPEAPLVAVLSHRTWIERFGGDPSVVGTSVSIAGVPGRIVGIMPAAFRLKLPTESLFLSDAEIWVPARLGGEYGRTRLYTEFTGLGRLRPDADFEQAQAELDRMMARIRESDPLVRGAGVVAKVRPLQLDVVKEIQPTLLILFAAAGLTLLVACANAASLLLGRGHARRQELSVRSALGAGRARLFFIVLVESVVLAAAAGAVGISLASAGIRSVRTLAGEGLPLLDAVTFDRGALMFAIGVSFAAALAAGLVPAVRASKGAARGLATSGRATDARAALRFRNGLVVVEVATSLVLLVAAGLLVRSFLALQTIHPGYDTQGILTFRIALPPDRYSTPDTRRAFFADLASRLEALPSVTSVSAVSQLPLSGRGLQGPYGYDERTRANWETVSADLRFVTTGYFETMGATMVAGREFTPDDHEAGRRTLIIDDRLAWEAFPEEGPIGAVGRRLQIAMGESLTEANSREIVGVVGHMNLHDLARPLLTQIYYPMGFAGRFSGADHFAVTVRAVGPLDPLAAAVRRAVEASGPGIALQDVESIAAAVGRARAASRIAFVLMALFGATALLLASIGVYGVLAFAVGSRTKEIGIRIALGQHPTSVVRRVVRRGMRLVVTAVAVGLVGAVAAARRGSELLHGVSPVDPATYLSAALIVVACGFLACWIPARGAMRVDPIEALRAE